MEQQSRKKNTGKKSNLRTIFAIYFLLSMLVIFAGIYGVITIYQDDLPSIQTLENIYNEQNLSTIIYSRDGEVLRALAQEKRFWITYDRLPQCMIDAVISAEDKRFFKHWGFSLPDFIRALIVNIKSLSIAQGGSTITQQLAKNLYFSPERILTRKLKELLTTIQIERTYSKPEILEMYLNKVELGNNTYGIQAASQLYFGKNAEDLNVPEAALLAGMMQNSAIHNPRSQLERRRISARNRRDLVLRMMYTAGKIPYSTMHEEISQPIRLALNTAPSHGKAPYFVEHVRNELIDKYGYNAVMTEGLKVQTTLDYQLQKIAEDSLRQQVDYIQKNYADKQLFYIRPEGLTNEEALRDSLDKTVVQAALIAVDVKTGAILAMVGGAGNYGENFFNRTTQSERQAGSVFKPFLYTAALDQGWRCCDTILDTYICYENVDSQGTIYEPQNFEKDFLGTISLREAFINSRNVVAVKLMNDTENRGIGPNNVIKYARKLGINTLRNYHAVHSLAVGTAPVKLIEMVSAFTVFPNLGIKAENFSIERVYDKNNNLKFAQPNNEGAKSEVLDPAIASLMLNLMRSVTTEGTAMRTLQRMGMSDRPSAGKTGTGNEYKDAWFVGYTPYIACGVWVGFDSEETTLGGNLYGTGAAAALPIWTGFMKGASEILKLPKDDFQYSSSITSQRICKSSYLKATASCPDSLIYTEYFIRGTEITEDCHIHEPRNNIGDSRYAPNGKKKRGF